MISVKGSMFGSETFPLAQIHAYYPMIAYMIPWGWRVWEAITFRGKGSRHPAAVLSTGQAEQAEALSRPGSLSGRTIPIQVYTIPNR
jgi:hypothetical protein